MTEWQKYTAMAARLGSIPPSKLNALPISIQKILEEDAPFAYQVVKAVIEFRDSYAESKTEYDIEATVNDFQARLEELGL